MLGQGKVAWVVTWRFSPAVVSKPELFLTSRLFAEPVKLTSGRRSCRRTNIPHSAVTAQEGGTNLQRGLVRAK
jgi:hypothetical protein